MNSYGNTDSRRNTENSLGCCLLSDAKGFVGESLYSQIETYLLENESIDDKTYEFLRNVSILRIIERCRNGSVDTAPINVTKLVCGIVHSAAKSDRIDIRLGSIDKDTIANIDPYIFSHCICEIIRNALTNDAGKNGTIEVSVLDNQSDIVLCVSDSGSGMTQRMRLHCLHPFHQEDKTELLNRGLGLGLTMVSYAATRFGGHIKIDSIEESGCMFFFTFPKEKSGTIPESTYEAGNFVSDKLSPLFVHLRRWLKP